MSFCCNTDQCSRLRDSLAGLIEMNWNAGSNRRGKMKVHRVTCRGHLYPEDDWILEPN